MRIITGKHGGRTLHPPKGLPVRPTTDFAKTGLFSVLRSRYDLSQFKILDLFSGTGSISLEFASAGCQQVIAVDKHPKCIMYLKSACTTLNENNIQVVKGDAFKFLTQYNDQFNIIFADPPYDMTEKTELVSLAFEQNRLLPDGVLILEHQAKEDLSSLSHYKFTKTYGNVAFSFFFNFVNESSENE